MPRNPYQSPAADAETVERDADHCPSSNPHLAPMFAMQRRVLLVISVTIGASALMQVLPPFPTLVYRLLSIATMLSLCVFWYHVFRAAAWNHSWPSGIGHVLASAFLTPCFLVGVLLVPVLIRGDASRLSDSPFALDQNETHRQLQQNESRRTNVN